MTWCSYPPAQTATYRAAIEEAIRRVLDSSNYVLGHEVAAFEAELAAHTGTAHAIGVNSGTDALCLVLRALGIGPGDEVITVSHTALATVAAVLMSGATPVLVDVDPTHYTMDPAAVERAVTPRTRAVIPVHLYGQMADLGAILAIARRHGLKVIEDCAQAQGARFGRTLAGASGDAGCFSFYPTKNLGAIGDGGAVVTADRELADRVRRLRQYGWDDARVGQEPGVNSRLDELQAAILRVKLPHLDADNDRRIALAARYGQGLAGLPVTVPAVRPGTRHVYHLFVIESDRRDALKAALEREGVMAGLHYAVPAHRHAGYVGRVVVAGGALPVTDSLVSRILTLPMYPELGVAEVDRVSAICRAALG
ncbi:MAG: DegT/DnrJ/EryC1/StrS family aminotransferase [Alphaproteobacteria bacterium]